MNVGLTLSYKWNIINNIDSSTSSLKHHHFHFTTHFLLNTRTLEKENFFYFRFLFKTIVSTYKYTSGYVCVCVYFFFAILSTIDIIAIWCVHIYIFCRSYWWLFVGWLVCFWYGLQVLTNNVHHVMLFVIVAGDAAAVVRYCSFFVIYLNNWQSLFVCSLMMMMIHFINFTIFYWMLQIVLLFVPHATTQWCMRKDNKNMY